MTLRHLLLTGLTILSLGLLSSFSLYAYNGRDFLQALLAQDIHDSKTFVRYKGVKRHSPEYKLLQNAIDQGYIRNKRLFLNLDEEFTTRSLQRFIRLTSNLSLQLDTDSSLKDEIREHAISQVRAQAYPRDPHTIKEELTKLMKQNQWRNQTRINHLLSLLWDDPYAQSLSWKQLNNFDESLHWSFIGLGIGIDRDAQGNAIIAELYDGPAKRHGLQQGDIIVRINNEIIWTKTNLTLIGDMIKNSESPDIHVAILRWSHIHEYTITRETITINPITIQELSPETTLMHIRSFQTNSYDHFVEQLSTIQQAPHLIIDLRNNLGGELNNTTQILQHFIPAQQAIYHIKEADTITPILSQWHQSHIRPSTHIDILINRNTASAAEIFASAIHEHFPSSRLIGEKSYGKGTIQSVRTNTHQAIKFTTGERLLPLSYRSIHKQGLMPDTIVMDDPLTTIDEVIESARLRNK